MNLFYIFFTFIFGLFSCQSGNSREDTLNKIHSYSHILKKEKGINCTMYGFRYAGPDKIYDGKIHAIVLGYSIDKRMQQEEARKLFYEVVDGLLTSINEDEKIRRYFFNDPVTYQDLEFFLAFDYEDKGFLKKDDVSSIHINNNKISYYIVDIDEFSDALIINEKSPGTKTLHFTGLDSLKRIRRDLPEVEDK